MASRLSSRTGSNPSSPTDSNHRLSNLMDSLIQTSLARRSRASTLSRPVDFSNRRLHRRKKKKWPWVVGGIVAFFVIVAIATGGGDKDKEESAAAPTTTQAAANGASVAAVAPAEAPKETKSSNPGIGEEVRDGKFGFVVTGIETGLTTIGDNPYLQEQAEGQFVLVHVEITNTSDKPQAYFGSNQTLIDTEGREFTNNTMAAINIDAETAIGGDINPGITRKTTIVFDIPTSATPKEIEVHDSMFSGGATISLQ